MKPPKKNPCGSCPYRQDVPSGVWHPEEYEKLPRYDAEMVEQPASIFGCHQQDDTFCSGWVGCHDMTRNLGLRVAVIQHHVDPDDIQEILDYECPVPLFKSGREAAEHGLKDIEEPGESARKTVDKLIRKGVVRHGDEPRKL